jgi:hypothetical protein
MLYITSILRYHDIAVCWPAVSYAYWQDAMLAVTCLHAMAMLVNTQRNPAAGLAQPGLPQLSG